jgi:hypothetical protein
MRKTQVWRCVVCLALLTVGFTSPTGVAADAHRTTYLTFSQPVRLPGVSLGAGTYSFELPDPTGAWDVVRVASRDGSRVFFTGFTQAIQRPASLARDVRITMGEATAGRPAPITAWYPHGESMGHRFVYAENR